MRGGRLIDPPTLASLALALAAVVRGWLILGAVPMACALPDGNVSLVVVAVAMEELTAVAVGVTITVQTTLIRAGPAARRGASVR